MPNLFKETKSVLNDHDKEITDVLWIGSLDGKLAISGADFEKIADFEYSSGFGAQHIATDIVIVGESWWMERSEYDGSERWSFKEMPKRHSCSRSFNALGGDDVMWETLEDINAPESVETSA